MQQLDHKLWVSLWSIRLGTVPPTFITTGEVINVGLMSPTDHRGPKCPFLMEWRLSVRTAAAFTANGTDQA